VHWPLIPADSGDAARDVFEAFTKQDALYKELAVGLDRPHAQWTPSWKTRGLPRNPFNIAFPHLHTANRLNWGLALRCIAAIRAGDAPRAHESAQIITRLTDACLQEPNLTGLLVAAAGANDLADATWELCNAQYGTADDFRRLELALAAMDFRRAAIRAYSGDLIDHVAQIQFLRSAPDLHAEFGNPSTTPIDLIVHCLPSGFLDASAATLADREFVYLVNPIRDHGWQAALASAREFETALQGTKPENLTHPSFIMSKITAPVTANAIRIAVYAQTLVNQAAIACALERFRIANGSYPNTLDPVTLADGKSLPMEVLSGRPMSYRTTANGNYALWSVGFSGRNHGGTRVLEEDDPGKTSFRSESYTGDWVWDFHGK